MTLEMMTKLIKQLEVNQNKMYLVINITNLSVLILSTVFIISLIVQ